MGCCRYGKNVLFIAFALVLSTRVLAAQTMDLIPRAAFGGYPTQFFQACLNLNSWSTVRSVTEYLGSFDGDLNTADDPTLATCFTNLRNAGLKLSIEAAAFSPGGGCGLASECFASLQPKLQRFRDLGAPSILLRMQEPLTVGRFKGWAFDDIVWQTADFVRLMRTNFSDIKIASVEAYPYNWDSLLFLWINRLHNESLAMGAQPPEFFELDHDRNAGGWSWSQVASIANAARGWGWGFGYIFGSPKPPNPTWHQAALSMGLGCQLNGIIPDHYTFESWEEDGDPAQTIPETSPGSSGYFMGTVREFRASGYFPY